MKTRLLLAFLTIAFIVEANAQGLDRSSFLTGRSKKAEKTTTDNIFTSGHTKPGETITKIEPDRVQRYAKVVKRYGRWEGYGKELTEKQASHLHRYFRLTYVAGAKYPARMEVLDGYHKLTTNHSIGTYLANHDDDDDTTIDSLWKEKLSTVCQWDFSYNEKDEIVRERAFDSDGNLVYAYHPVKIGDRVAGTFTDAWGMPAKLRQEGSAQVVYITYDDNGFECLHEYYDELGYRQKDKDEAYIVRIENSKDGLVLSRASCNIAGQRMIDIFGNCGMQTEYNDDGTDKFDINMDEHWQPCRVEHGNDPFYYNMIKRHYKYDVYGRLTRMWFTDLEDRADTNNVGIHSIEYTYNPRGKTTSFTYKDIHGKTKINPYDGRSGWRQKYDDATGRLLSLDLYGDSAVLSQTNYEHMEWIYNKEGEQIGRLNRNFDGSTVEYTYYEKTNGGLRKLTKNDAKPKNYVEKRTYSGENQVVTIEYDEYGHQLLWEYTDLQGNPIEPYGYFRDIEEYVYQGDSLEINTEYFIGAKGDTITRSGKDWTIRQYITHFTNGTKDYCDVVFRDKDMTINHAYRNTYDAMGNKTSEGNLNRFLQRSRTGQSNIVYYLCKTEYDIKGDKLASVISTNEFGEPSYLESGSGVSHYWNLAGGDITYYDEHGHPINDMDTFSDSLPAVMSVVVTDSAAYRNQLKEGDVIVKFGDWVSNMKMQTLLSQNRFYFELISKAAYEKEMLVLRHHPESNYSEIVPIHLPKGTAQELGFFPQLVYYTEREKQRYEETLQGYLSAHHMASLEGESEPDGPHFIIIRIPNHRRGNVPTLGNPAPYIFNPAVVFSMAKYEIRDDMIIADKYWNLGMGTDTLSNMIDGDDSDEYYLSMSIDLENTVFGVKNDSDDHIWRGMRVNDEQYARIAELQEDFMNRMSSTFNPLFRKPLVEVPIGKKELKRITPQKFFKMEKKKAGVSYLSNALSYLSNENLFYPIAFNGLQRIHVGSAVSPQELEFLRRARYQIDTTGFIRLPNFYPEDLALVHPTKEGSFDEFFLMYFNADKSADLFYQKGTFSIEDLLALQEKYGKKDVIFLGEGIDSKTMPFITVNTDGLMRDSGLEGSFVICRFNNWAAGQGINAFDEEIEASRHVTRQMIIIPVDPETGLVIGSPIQKGFAPGILGVLLERKLVPMATYHTALEAVK